MFGVLQITVSAAMYPGHALAGVTLAFSCPPSVGVTPQERAAHIRPIFHDVVIGRDKNGALDKLTPGRIEPDASSAVVSFCGEERGLWVLLVRAPPDHLRRAFDGEDRVSLCCVYTYEVSTPVICHDLGPIME